MQKNVENSGVKEYFSSDDDDFDPHLHRNVPNPTNNFETLAHIVKTALGTGIVAMPLAFLHAGYLLGLVGTFFLGVLCTYSLHLLIKTQYKICKKYRLPFLSYPESMRIALEEGPDCLKPLAPLSPFVINIFLIILQLAACSVYIVFVANNIKQLVDSFWFEMDVKLHMLIILGPLILLNCIPNLKILAPASMAANCITFVALGLLLVFIFDALPSPDERDAFAAIDKIPLFFGTVIFALEIVGVIIALENNMKTPKSFGGWFGVLNIGMFFITFLYACIGFLGYLRYGESVIGSITLNIPQQAPIAIAIRIMFAVQVFISYGLQCYIPVDILWKTYIQKRFVHSNHQITAKYVLRISIVLVTFLVALCVPRLGLFTSFCGALCLSALGIAFPAIMELCIAWPNNLGWANYIVWKNVILIIFALIGLVAGTYEFVDSPAKLGVLYGIT